MNDQVNDPAFGPYEERHKSTTTAINILGRVIMASVSAVGIYAVISGRAALLMPLYAMLLVDFFFALPAFYNRDLDSSMVDGIGNYRGYPDAGGLGPSGFGGTGGGVPGTTPGTQYTRFSLIAVSTATMIVRIYFLCVIWKCYRYLRLIELVSPIRLSEIYPHIHPGGSHPQYPIVRVLSTADSTDPSGAGHNMAPPPYDSIASTMKPPNYEEAMKSSGMMVYPATTHTSSMNPAAVAPMLVPNQNATIAQQQQHAVVFTDPNPTSEHIVPIPSGQVISTISLNECYMAPQSDQQQLQQQQPANAQLVVDIDTTTDTTTCNSITHSDERRRETSATTLRANAAQDTHSENFHDESSNHGRRYNPTDNSAESLSCTATGKQHSASPVPDATAPGPAPDSTPTTGHTDASHPGANDKFDGEGANKHAE